MRHLTAILLLSTAPAALWADTIEGNAKISAATIYAWGASVTRSVEIAPQAGTHELILTGMPAGIDPASLRVSATGAIIGAVGLQSGRPFPGDDTPDPAVKAAKDSVKAAERALREFDAQVQTVQLRAEAARQQIEMIREFARVDNSITGTEAAPTLESLGQTIANALQQAHQAEQEALTMLEGREDLVKALENALARLAALTPGDLTGETLVITLQSEGGPVRVSVDNFDNTASWRPVYDLRLNGIDDLETATLAMDRGVVVTQSSGEDWQGVDLRLSTARPDERVDPSDMYPWLRQIYSLEKQKMRSSSDYARELPVPEGYVAPIADVEPVVVDMAAAAMDVSGMVVTYHYPTPVNLRSAADTLRLNLDSLSLDPTLIAEAVPQSDSTAYLVADTRNTTGEVLLPGETTVHVDGAMIGRSQMELAAAGDKMKLGFGPIHGLLLKTIVPERQQGDSGIISKSNVVDSIETLRVENVTGREWPLRVIARIPYSEQEDLEIKWSANPAPDQTDLDDKRGVLAWESTIAPGQTQDISLTSAIRWPQDYELN